MSTVRIFLGTLGGLVVATALAGGCSGETPMNTYGTSACSDRTQVSLPMCSVTGEDPFSDEACQNLDDQLRRTPPTPDDSRAPSILAPAQDERISRLIPYTFRWSTPTATLRLRPMTLGDELSRWMTLLPTAEAHCRPFNGRGYELVFRVAGRIILRRQQSSTSWTPDTLAWTILTTDGANASVELSIATTTFSNSQVGSNRIFTHATPRSFRFFTP